MRKLLAGFSGGCTCCAGRACGDGEKKVDEGTQKIVEEDLCGLQLW